MNDEKDYSSTKILDDLGIFESRLLIFLETSPQSNRYHQLLLNGEQFKSFSGLVEVVGRKQEDGGVALKTSEKTYLLPDLNSINATSR